MITELLGPGDRVLCAVSGGRDSIALLHWLFSKREQLGITVFAAHYEHGLRGEESLRDAAFVEQWCREREIPCVIEHGDVLTQARERRRGVEETARELRYAFLERTADRLQCTRITTAHNADDNAETILFHLLRGSGAAGLRGIPRERGRIVRPLLDTTRADIDAYLETHGLSCVEDSTNSGDVYARNRLRHAVFPVLRELNGETSAAMGRTAALLGRDEDCLAQQAEAFLESAFDGESLPLNALNALHPALASRAVRRLWPQALSYEQTESVLAFAKGTERGFLALPGGRLRRERGRLYFKEESPFSPLPARELPLGGRLEVPEAELVIESEFFAKKEEIHGLFKTYDFKCESICGKILCTGRREGDRFRPAGRGCGKSLKALFAERGLTLRQRERVPVLRDEAGILAVLGFGQDERSVAQPGDSVWRIRWNYDTGV